MQRMFYRQCQFLPQCFFRSVSSLNTIWYEVKFNLISYMATQLLKRFNRNFVQNQIPQNHQNFSKNLGNVNNLLTI